LVVGATKIGFDFGIKFCCRWQIHSDAKQTLFIINRLYAFSVSLAVKDIAMSKQFYQKLGFAVAGDDEAQNWLKNYGHRLEKRFAHHS
jgi:hypothetical protein